MLFLACFPTTSSSSRCGSNAPYRFMSGGNGWLKFARKFGELPRKNRVLGYEIKSQSGVYCSLVGSPPPKKNKLKEQSTTFFQRTTFHQKHPEINMVLVNKRKKHQLQLFSFSENHHATLHADVPTLEFFVFFRGFVLGNLGIMSCPFLDP